MSAKALWKNFSKEELQKFVEESISFRSLAQKIGYHVDSGSTQAADMVDFYGFDTSHFKGSGWSRGNINLEKYQKGSSVKSHQGLRDLILLRGRKCEQCRLTEWQGKEIPLEMHHIDGDHFNSDLSNLILLCRNCHALTDNYGSKNKRASIPEEILVEALKTSPNVRQALLKVGLTGKGKNYDRCYELIHKYNISNLLMDKEKNKSHKPIQKLKLAKNGKREYKARIFHPKTTLFCQRCGKPLASHNPIVRHCPECSYFLQRRCEWPTREQLKQEIFTTPFLQLSKKYGVSDAAIRKWCKNYGLPYKHNEIKSYTPEEWEKI